MDVTWPEQIVWVTGVTVAAGTGFTVITTVIGNPGQPADVGVTVYVTVPGVMPVFDKTCAMEFPLPALAPVTPADETTVQVKVVPLTALLRAMEVVWPEQMVCAAGVAAATGIGLTVITTVMGAPGHPAAVGVTV